MADAVLLVDRFVSASSATDAHDSLQALLEALVSSEEEKRVSAEVIWNDDALLEALLQVLATASFQDIPLEEGPALVCRIYQQLWKADGASNVLPKQPSPGRLVQSLVDVASDTSSSDYTRVLALQVLNDTCTKAPSKAQTQLLEIPNGLHRLADIFQEANDQVRNELLGGVAQTIARWPSCAKIWTFSEVCDTLLVLSMQEGGLTRGPVLVRDCLMLVESLVDPTLADLLWQSPVFAPKLAALLDLRGGTEFLNPPSSKPTVSQTDDLDAILATGNQKSKRETTTVLPKLTFNEEDVVMKVLNILSILLESPSQRPQVWNQHAPLASLVWELALISRPPPDTKPVCALPSAKLQQVALETTAQFFNDAATMKQHHGLDRLLYLVCTGGTTPKWPEKLGLSQAALHVLRQTLQQDEARDVLTHTLAPPPANDFDDQPPPPTVVQKLLNTLFENMETNDHKLERRRINLLGALGALSVFLNSPTDREVLLGITSSNGLINVILQCLEHEEDEIVQLSLLRFACEWVVEAPAVVQAFLASSHSIVLSVLLGSANKIGTSTSVRTMAAYFLGLALEYMPNGSDDKHGGWTKQSIMELLSKRKGGISGYTTALEELKTADLPWKACALEWQRFLRWYSAEVLTIRQCVVKELTSGGGDADDDGDGDNSGSLNTSTKSLNRLVTQQAKELEEMRYSLNEAKATIESQDGQLSAWKRRVESNPTQIDDLLTEYTEKTAEMEKETSALKKLIYEKEESFEAQLAERDGRILQLQAAVDEWQCQEREVRQERDGLRGELQGLSSAYNALEQEFNRRDGPDIRDQTVAVASTGEASEDRSVQQPEGEVSHQEQSPSPELATLRVENARLRSDAQAADDWMAMAVQRMNDIGGQNQALQQEVENLAGQLQQTQLTQGITAPVVRGTTQDQLNERLHLEQLEQQLDDTRNANSELDAEIRSLRQQLDENSAKALGAGAVVEDLKRRVADAEKQVFVLEKQLENAQKDTNDAMDSLGESKSEKERLKRIVANMEGELQNSRSEIAAKSKDVESAVDEKNAAIASKDNELETLRSLIASKDEELIRTRQQTAELRESVGSESDYNEDHQEISSLRKSAQELTDELERTRRDLQTTESREREEIRRRDERIREFEMLSSQKQQESSDITSAEGGLFASGSESHEEEIKSLREANEAAQEWMAKAVEHHTMLSEQVSALTEDKVDLTRQIKELQKQLVSGAGPTDAGSSSETTKRLEHQLSERTTEVTDLGARIIKLESDIRIKETEMAGVQEKLDQCEELQKQVDVLQGAKDRQLEQIRSLEDSSSNLQADNESLGDQLQRLREDLDAKDELIAASAGKLSAASASLGAPLKERDREREELQEELERATRASRDADECRIALQNATEESARLRAALDDAQSQLTSMKDKTASVERLQEELQALRDVSLKPEAGDRVRDYEMESVVAERDIMKENVSRLEARLSEFQIWAHAAELKITELQNERAALAKATKSTQEQSVCGAENAAVDGLANLVSERDNLKESVAALESQLSEFRAWSDAAQRKITELQKEKEAREQGMKTPQDSFIESSSGQHDVIAAGNLELASLTAERDALKEKVWENENQLLELKSWSDAAQKKIEELQDEKDASDKEVTALTESEKGARAELGSLREEVELKSDALLNALEEVEELKAAKEALESFNETAERLHDKSASSEQLLASVTLERDALKKTVSEMEVQLSEFQSWSDAAQVRIKELQDEKDSLDKEITLLADSERNGRALLASTCQEMDAKSAELLNALEEVEELKTSKELLMSDSETAVRLRDEIASSEQQRASLTLERDTLKATARQLEEQLTERESRTRPAQERISELHDDKVGLEQEVVALAESEKAARAELASLRVDIEAKSTEMSHALAENEKLQATKISLETQLLKSNVEKDGALAKHTGLENTVRDLEAQCGALLERDRETGILLTDKEESLRAAEEVVATLQSSLEMMQEESANVVGEWKAQVEALESTVADLEAALQQQQVEASDAVEQWSVRWSELKSMKSELELNLECVSKERDNLKQEQEIGWKDVLARFEVERGSERAEWDAERKRLEASIDEHSESLALNAQYLEAAKEELCQTRTSAAETIDEWKNRVEEMEDKIEELEEAVTHRGHEAEEAIARWEAHCNVVEEQVTTLERDLEAVAREKDDYRMSVEKSIEPLSEHLEKERDARKSLEEEKEDVILQIEAIKVQSEGVVNEWKGRVQELENNTLELENQLEVQQEEATRAIAQWEATCSALEQAANLLEADVEASISVLRGELENRRDLATRTLSKLGRGVETSELTQVAPMNETSSETILWLQAMLNSSNELLSDAVESLLVERESRCIDQQHERELQVRQKEIVTLEENIKRLQEEIADQAAARERSRDLEIALEAEKVNLTEMKATLEAKCELSKTLEVELNRLRREMERNSAETQANLSVERSARDAAELKLAELQETVSETEEAFRNLAEKEGEIFSESKHTKADSTRMQQQLRTRESEWQSERKILEQERDDLRATVGELQEELRDASDALQACVTDELSEKAAEAASRALRYHMEQLQSQVTKYTDACAVERKSRLTAEKEVEALKEDLANVLGVMDGDGDASSRIQKITMRASEAMHRRESDEIENIRKALERSLQELESAQAAERKAAEDAAASRLQLSICEQEVFTAKSDLAFLTQTLEETREAEASKAASLEYRISSLEDDRDVLRQFHRDELENLRNELTHVTMEKDRIMHSLKESEKKNAALVFSTSKKREIDGSASPEAELSRLRVEKAQLLSAAAEEGSRTERRIRDAVAAHVSSMEADVILERELRIAAEATVEDIKFQMEGLKSEEVVDENRDADESCSDSFLETLSAELKRFKDETRTLSEENAALRKELEETKENSQVELVELTAKYRKAQVKAHMLSTCDDFNAEVNVDVAKLRSNGEERDGRENWIVLRDDRVEDEIHPPDLSAVGTFDMVQRQKIAIQEERAMYLELLAEHDDLLALLAQQDLEKASLNDALARVAGQEAVAAALEEAEMNAVKRYGMYVKLTS